MSKPDQTPQPQPYRQPTPPSGSPSVGLSEAVKVGFALAAAVVPATTVYGVLQYRVDALERRATVTEARLDRGAEGAATQDRRLAVLEERLATIADTLKRVDGKVDQLIDERRGK